MMKSKVCKHSQVESKVYSKNVKFNQNEILSILKKVYFERFLMFFALIIVFGLFNDLKLNILATYTKKDLYTTDT